MKSIINIYKIIYITKVNILGLFANLTQNSNSTLELTHIFLNFSFALFTHKFILFTKMPLVLFSKNDVFTLSTSSSSSIYKIVIDINTPTTMNNQSEALNAPQIDLHSFFRNSYELKTTSLSLYFHIHPKKLKILILKFLWFNEALKLILRGSLLFGILGAWKRYMCAKQVISHGSRLG